MRVVEWIEDNIVALVVAASVGAPAALAGWLCTIFIGAKFFRSEWSYGFPLAFGVPVASLAGGLAFCPIFRKLR